MYADISLHLTALQQPHELTLYRQMPGIRKRYAKMNQ